MAAVSHLKNKKEAKLREGIEKVVYQYFQNGTVFVTWIFILRS